MTWVLWDLLVPLIFSFGLGLLLGYMLWRWRRKALSAKAMAPDNESNALDLLGTDADIQKAVGELETANITLIGERDKATAAYEKLRADYDTLKSEKAELTISENAVANSITAPLNLTDEDAQSKQIDQFRVEVNGLKAAVDSEKKAKRELELELLNAKNKNNKLEAKLAVDPEISIADEFDVMNSGVVSHKGIDNDPAATVDLVDEDFAIESLSETVVEQPKTPVFNDADNHTSHFTVASVSESSATAKTTPSGYAPVGWTVPANAPSKQERDKLTDIKGVGPVLEKKLHQAGIYYFDQVAKLDNNGINELQLQIPEFPGRIKRDNWVKQAKEMLKDKHRA